MPDPVESPDVVHAIGGPRLRLVFVWTGDRWSHRIEIDGRVFAVPVELPPESEVPSRVVSPTYQQLNFQDAPDGARLALLVGQSGPHHFSAVFTLRETDGATTLEIDVADRSSREVERFAATYTVAATSSDLVDGDDRSALWSREGTSVRFEAVPPASSALAEAGRSASRVQALGRIDPREKTQRFVYRWSAESARSPG